MGSGWGYLDQVQDLYNKAAQQASDAGQAVPNDNFFAQNFNKEKARQANNAAQLAANNIGANNIITEKTGAGGLPGIFGEKDDYKIALGGNIQDPNYDFNRLGISAARDNAGKMPIRQMDSASAGAALQSNGTLIDPSQQAQFRDQQLSLGQSLMAQANGQGPSVAGSQLQQSTEMNLQAALAQAASQRGGNLGAAQYALGNARANIQQQAAQQLAQTRIQEQMAARSQLGDVLNAGRGADIGLATNQAQLGQQNNQFNAGAVNQQNQFNAGLQQNTNATNLQSGAQQDQAKQQLIQQYLAMGLNYDQANYQAQIQQNQFNAGAYNQAVAASHGVGIQNSANSTQLAGAGISALGTIGAAAAMASDERLKTDIEDGEEKTAAFLDSLIAKSYRYKDEKYGVGHRVGIMAQDAEKSELGRYLVMNTPEGKMLDTNKVLSAALASVAHLNKRVKNLER